MSRRNAVLIPVSLVCILLTLVACAAPTPATSPPSRESNSPPSEASNNRRTDTIPDVTPLNFDEEEKLPDDVLREVAFGGTGGVGECNDETQLRIDLISSEYRIPRESVRWAVFGLEEQANVILEYPSGIIDTYTLYPRDDQNCAFEFFEIGPGTELGRYTLTVVEGNEEDTTSFTLIESTVPSIQYLQSDVIWLHGFRSQENVRLIFFMEGTGYESQLLAEMKLQTNSDGMAVISGVPEYEDIVAVGERSGQVAPFGVQIDGSVINENASQSSNGTNGNNDQESSGSSANSAPTFSCPGSITPRLEVGGRGRVIADGTGDLFMRAQPDRSAALVYKIFEGHTFEIIDGPACADNWVWWEVRYDGQTGWAAEGNIERYFVEPSN